MPKVVVDFTDSEGSGGRIRIPEDDYRAKITKVTLGESKRTQNPMLTWEYTISEGKFKGKKLIDRTVLTKEAAWKVRQILEAMGTTVKPKKLQFDTDKYVGEEIGITVTDREYEGKIGSEVSDYLSADQVGEVDDELEVDDVEEEDEVEEPVAKKKGKKGKGAKGANGKKRKASSDDEDDDDEDIEELDLDSV